VGTTSVRHRLAIAGVLVLLALPAVIAGGMQLFR